MTSYLGRFFVILMLFQFEAFAGQQEVKVDLSQYNSSCPVQINMEGNALHAIWQSADHTRFLLDVNLLSTKPLINSISIATDENSPFVTLAETIQPGFQVTIGIRDAKLDPNWPWIFFDNPLLIHHRSNGLRNGSLPDQNPDSAINQKYQAIDHLSLV